MRVFVLFSIIHGVSSACDDGTDQFLVFLYDKFGDGWNSNDLRITHCDENRTAYDPAHDPITLDDGFDKETYVCLPPDIEDQPYEITLNGGTFQPEVSWNITYPPEKNPDDDEFASGTVWHGGGAPFFYSSCPTPSPTVCSGHSFTIQMSDTYGDGWQSNELVLKDCDGSLLKEGLTLVEGAYEEVQVCLGVDEFEVECGGGLWAEEVHWAVVDDDTQQVVMSGGDPGDVSTCKSCAQQGGENVTVLVVAAHMPHGGEWWDPDADSFVDIEFGNTGLLTSMKENDNDPTWNEYLDFGCLLAHEEVMSVKVIDEDDLGPNDLMVFNEWADWREWPPGKTKRLNDTNQNTDDAYHKEYYVEVKYFINREIPAEPTKAPTAKPTVAVTGAPTAKPVATPPTPTPPTPTPPTPPSSGTKAPTHEPTTAGKDAEEGSSHHTSSASTLGGGAVAAIVLGVVLTVLAACGGGTAYYAKTKGYSSAGELLSELGSGMGSYAPMGGSSSSPSSSGGGGQGMRAGVSSGVGMNFNSLQSKDMDGQQAGAGGEGGGGYMPPTLAEPSNEDDEDEEDVSLGARSAVV
mmetsp:Transcript_50888/g.100721  ORF Transcript_50888/g.100721 Transcript_50888/m.100721 type:complete len:575 (-) Transcript_50888:401-2125(-)